ncbi:MAG: lipopolysaccharide heptosyltransferase I [Syntrophomonadaceae bacterium]
MKILIVRLSAMGDVVHALPIAENAAAAGAEVAWVIEPAFAGLLEGSPHCARVLLADTRDWRRRPLAAATRRSIAALRAGCRAFAPNVTLDVQGLFKSALIARLAGAPVVGFSFGARREPLSAPLCHVRVSPGPDARHVVDRNLALLSAAGIPATVRAPDARYLLAVPRPEADAFVAAQPPRYAVLHPGAARAAKTWGEERYARLAVALEERGVATVLSWGPGDEARVERLTALAPRARRAPRLDLPALARLCARARLFVGGDTGPLHLADAVGTPTLALYGPTDPERNGPYRDRRGVIRDMHHATDAAVLERALALVDQAGRL